MGKGTIALVIIWYAMSEDKEIIRRGQVEALQEIWPKLTPRQRVCISLYWAGFSQSEIAQITGISRRTVIRDWDKICDLG